MKSSVVKHNLRDREFPRAERYLAQRISRAIQKGEPCQNLGHPDEGTQIHPLNVALVILFKDCFASLINTHLVYYFKRLKIFKYDSHFHMVKMASTRRRFIFIF